jgi:polysaccharide pyruvyl transferase WcaK-like protein
MSELKKISQIALRSSTDRSLTDSKIVICGEVYSANLGDEILGYSFTHLLQQQLPTANIQRLDLSSRLPCRQKQLQERPLHMAGQSGHPIARRLWAMALKVLPQPMVAVLWWWVNWKKRRDDFYTQVLQGADALVIGGGNLLIDNQLDFPFKVYGVATCARRMDIPVFYYGCGVGQRWSWIATVLLRKSLLEAEAIAVRDQTSYERLMQRVPKMADKFSVVWDVAVCCAEAYDAVPSRSSAGIGLGICAPQVLARHVQGSADYFQSETLLAFWIDVAKLISPSYDIQLFTNGSKVDQGFAEKVQEHLISVGIPVQPKVAIPQSGEDLVNIIRNFQGVLAFRLHACIVSYSLGLPTVGLKWDTKVESFFEKCGRKHDCLDPQNVSVERIVQTLMEAIVQPHGEIAAIKTASLGEIAQLAKAIASCSVPAL